MNATQQTTASSPCIGVCRIVDGYCQGCWRDLNEIAAWSAMSEAQRLDIMAQLAARARLLGDHSS